MRSLYDLPLYLISLYFIAIGLTVLIRKKPVIMNSRWFLLIMLLVFVPISIRGILMNGNSITYMVPIMFLVLIGYMYYILKGYMVIGADADNFQKAFIETLHQGNYEFEQTFTSIKIKEPALEISVAFQSWVGSGQIRMRSKENEETFKKIIRDIKTKDIKTNLIIPFFYLIVGIFLLGLAIKALSAVNLH